jgi:predicted nucleotidyltransferase
MDSYISYLWVEAMRIQAKYPTVEHKRASEAATEFFAKFSDVEAVILKGSCARGKASRDSCIDIAVLLQPTVFAKRKDDLEQEWNKFYKKAEVFKSLQKVGKYSEVHLDFIDGDFEPKPRNWTSGPDEFELEIGNSLVYTVPLLVHDNYLCDLKAKWLPYYDEKLRKERLSMVCRYCRNNLDHVPLYVDRALYFQAFHRLYDAFREFLQALFISRRTYPIAYDKWIREQIEEILKLPELYRKLPKLFEIKHFESQETTQKAKDLSNLLKNYVETR